MATTNGTHSHPPITLYTNHGCPWAHRAHIAIKELGLKYDEVIIDLDTPREEWYLKVNPRGLVPSIKYGDEIITESAVVAQFLADLHPEKHLLPASSTPEGALFRARVAFFADAVTSKVWSQVFPALRATSAEAKAESIATLLKNVEKEVEPLLKDAAPFFLGSSKPTLAEALTAPFIVRIYDLSNDVLLPSSLPASLDKLPNFSRWAKATRQLESVTYVWDAEKVAARMQARFAQK